MKIQSIEFKNIAAFGEEMQTITYDSDGTLIILKGQSGAGKSTILSLPIILLYGKIEKVPKTAIANRINKNGFIRGTIIKGNHTYVIERKFQPNALTVFKDGVNIENYGTRDAQQYIDNEIIEIPQSTFSNMISISMKKFKSFLTMSPADRKQIIDRVFSLEIINNVFERVKKDMRELGNSINSDNTSLYQLQQTIQNANYELTKIQDKLKTQEDKQQIEENNAKILAHNENLQKLGAAYEQYAGQQQTISQEIQAYKKQQIENDVAIRQLNEKLNLFKQEKCPTCGTSFNSSNFEEVRTQLQTAIEQRNAINEQLLAKIQEMTTNSNAIAEYLGKINQAVYAIRTDINNLNNSNALIQEKLKSSGEYQGVVNIINKTTEQIDVIKEALNEKNLQMVDLSNLSMVYSIDGVKQKVINNYLPILNNEIYDNLELLNFPYQLEFDSKFDPHLKDTGIDMSVETLSDGEMTRIDMVVLCSLFKLLKKRYPSINIFSIDELLSTLDTYNSQVLLKFLHEFAKNMGLNIFVVSHVNIDTEYFDRSMEVSRGENGFSKIHEENLMA